MTTQDQLDDLTTTIGEALRETWLKGYTTAASEVLGNAITDLEQRIKNTGNEGTINGLEIAIAMLKEQLK
jgi:hypothetical protein